MSTDSKNRLLELQLDKYEGKKKPERAGIFKRKADGNTGSEVKPKKEKPEKQLKEQ